MKIHHPYILSFLGKNLTDQMLDKLSAKLDREEAEHLAGILGMSVKDIDHYLSMNGVSTKETIFSLLKRWLKRQNRREEAYDLMAQALYDAGLNLWVGEILDYPQIKGKFQKGGKQLQNDQLKKISEKLRKDDMYRLAPKLNISPVMIDSKFVSYSSSTTEAILKTLQSWLKRQNSREEAYEKLGEALIHPDVGLNLIAGEVLGYTAAPEQHWLINWPKEIYCWFQTSDVKLEDHHLESLSDRLNKEDMCRLGYRLS